MTGSGGDQFAALKRQRVLLSLMDPDSAGYDELVRGIEALERSSADFSTEWAPDEPATLRRVVSMRIETAAEVRVSTGRRASEKSVV
jgi:hypothetical protein